MGVIEQLMDIKSVEDAQTIFNQNGLPVSVEEADDIIRSIVDLSDASEPDGEMSEDQLANVSGGGVIMKGALRLLKKTWDFSVKTWGSPKNAVRATTSFWKNAVTKGWGYARDNVGRY